MPKTKNQGKNKSRFEVRGGVPNEFEFAQNEGAMTEAEHERFTPPGDQSGFPEAAGESPQERAGRVNQLMAEARDEAERRLRLPNAPTVSGAHPVKAKKAAQKSGKKSGQAGERTRATVAKKSAAKGGAKTSAAKKVATKKGATKKAAAQKSAKKSARR